MSRRDTPEAPETKSELQELLYWMRLTRALDQRVHILFKQGKIPGGIFSQEGHEAISVGTASALEPGDVIAPLHRDLGTYLVRGMKPERIIAQAMGRADSPSRGRDVNQHGLGDLSLGIIGHVSHIPQSLPVALGCAYAFQYQGERKVAMTYFGDGGSSEGGAHEAMNLAAVLRAPVIFVLEHNQFAYSTPSRHQFAVDDLSVRAAGYGMPGVSVDGNDLLAVREAAREAAGRARSGGGPTLIVARTLRMQGHSVHDPADYVPRELLAEWKAKDPIRRFEAFLRGEGALDDAASAKIDERIRAELDEAAQRAERSPWPDPATLTEGLFA